MSAPARAGEGGARFVRIISSETEGQSPLVTVHRKTACAPTARPVTVVAGFVGLVIVTDPLTRLQTPVPSSGTSATIRKLPLLHCVMSSPASAAAGGVSTTTAIGRLTAEHP